MRMNQSFVEDKKPIADSSESLLKQLQWLNKSGYLEDIDVALAKLFSEIPETNDYYLLAAIAWLSWANRQGHSSINLKTLYENPLYLHREGVNTDNIYISVFEKWAEKISRNPAVSLNGLDEDKPLVLQGNQLYSLRMFAYETWVAESLSKKASVSFSIDSNHDLIKKRLSEWFNSGIESVWQKAACLHAIGRKLTIITGGPGTGKTHTVLRLMALLLEIDTEKKQQIALAAPTGKAAARVRESILAGLKALELPESIEERIPVQAKTIHRLLGTRFRSTHFKHNRENPLPYSVVIIDEASMIDLSLMSKLISALRDDATLILLGDKDQLASVEAGSVFADLCSYRDLNLIEPSFHKTASSVGLELNTPEETSTSSPINKCIVQLTHSRRFRDDSGIGQLAKAVNRGDVTRVFELLEEKQLNDELVWIPDSGSVMNHVLPYLKEQFSVYKSDSEDNVKLETMRTFQLLCAHKVGKLGVDDINTQTERLLRVSSYQNPWYVGRPVIMTRNDYQLKLFNGDVGLCVDDNDENQSDLRVVMEQFNDESNDITVQSWLPARLTEMQTCWGLSVHKSQGSEYDRVALILPEKPSPVLTRELIYTAITRAKKHIMIFGSKDVIRHAVSHPTVRSGGLKDKLI